MGLSRLALVLCVMFWLTSVQGALVMNPINTTITVEKTHFPLAQPKLGAEYKMKVPSVSTISCRMSDETALISPSIKWQKLGSKSGISFTVAETQSSDQRSFESKLTVADTSSVYVCTGKSGNQTINATAAIVSPPLLGFSAVSGDPPVHQISSVPVKNYWQFVVQPDVRIQPDVAATIMCVNFGFPVGETRWWRLDANGRETKASAGPKLEFNSTSYSNDRGFYVCRSENIAGKGSYRIFLRVENPKAFVYPLVIFCCLIALVAAISIAYEIGRRRERSKRREARRSTDPDDQPETT